MMPVQNHMTIRNLVNTDGTAYVSDSDEACRFVRVAHGSGSKQAFTQWQHRAKDALESPVTTRRSLEP